MGCAPMAYLLWSKFMNYNPQNPKWSNRDRFVLSNGHGCALQYTMLHLAGYDVTMEDLKNFRQYGSRTPGHPENFVTAGIEVTTGPLGQGIANAVGIAWASKHMAATFNKPNFPVVNNKVYCIVGDGCLQEGISGEASSLAGHLQLNNLVVLYDDNKITIDGATEISFTEDVPARYAAYGWHCITVQNGDTDLVALAAALEEAKNITDRPTFISVKTTIGFGSVNQGTSGVHGSPLKADDLNQIKVKFGMDPTKKFFIEDEVLAEFRKQVPIGAQKEQAWNTMFASYKAAYPTEAADFERRQRGELPTGWKNALPKWTVGDKALATRQTSEIVLNAIAPIMPELVGGSADLTPSNLTWMKCSTDYQPSRPEGRYLRFGIREHAMAAICNGFVAYGGLIPFCSTFFNFIQYCLPSIRLSALSKFGVIYIMTHDSIGLGEDGPTHQPINALICIRSMPNILGIRPCDGNETAGAYALALENRHRPSVLVLSRQALPQQANSTAEKVAFGAYVLEDVAEPKLILIASGSEVPACVEAAKLCPFAVRVVSMPCMDLFAEQSIEYQKSVLLEGVPVMSVEALGVTGWEKWSHVQQGMTTFGKSAPAPLLFKHFGFDPESLAAKSKKIVEFYKTNAVPSLLNRPQF